MRSDVTEIFEVLAEAHSVPRALRAAKAWEDFLVMLPSTFSLTVAKRCCSYMCLSTATFFRFEWDITDDEQQHDTVTG